MNKLGFCESHIVIDEDKYNAFQKTNRIIESEKISDDAVYVAVEPKSVTLYNPIACPVHPSNWQAIWFQHYHIMKDWYGDKLRNIQFDTDSFHNVMYEEDLEGDIVKRGSEKNDLIGNTARCSRSLG